MKLTKGRYVAIAVFLFGLIMFWQSLKIVPLFPTGQGDCGPSFFPAFLSAGLMVSAVGKYLFPIGDKEKEEPYMAKGGWLKAVLVILWCVIYVLGLQHIGFFVTTSVMLFLLVLLLGWNEKTNLLLAGVYSVGLSGGIYLLFTKVLGTLLPRGILF